MNMMSDLHERPSQLARAIAPDFVALVGLLAASQAVSPTARLATRLARGTGVRDDGVAALTALFAPRHGEGWCAAALQGCFDPAVSLSHNPSTRHKPW